MNPINKVGVKLTNIDTEQEYEFESMADACRFLGRNVNYLYDCAAKKKTYAVSRDKSNGYPSQFNFEFKGKAEIAIRHKGKTNAVARMQLCSYCAKCNKNECLFIASGGTLPIVGWTATDTVIKCGTAPFMTEEKSWSISECPNFYPDAAIIKGKAEMSAVDWASLNPYADMIHQLQCDFAESQEAFRQVIKNG